MFFSFLKDYPQEKKNNQSFKKLFVLRASERESGKGRTCEVLGHLYGLDCKLVAMIRIRESDWGIMFVTHIDSASGCFFILDSLIPN